MTEVVLFGIVGLIAVAAAAFMVISPTKNAVHSALALVLTMGCLAFLFLMLNAPFLAMIQITVYAGAIMVLFIFVIMLLGAEKLDVRETRFPWLPVLGLVLAIVLLLVIGLPILNSGLNVMEPVANAPRVRVVNAASDLAPVNVAFNEQVVATDLEFGAVSQFTPVPAGDYSVTVTPEGGAPITTAVNLEPNSTQTVIAYGDAANVMFAVVPDDLSTVSEARSSRVVVFNAYDPQTTVSLVDFGSDSNAADTTTYANEVGYGTYSEPVILEEGAHNLAYIAGGDVPDADSELVLFRNQEYELPRDESQLIVVMPEPLFDGTVRAAAVTFADTARASFGGPRAVGTLLFVDYMLPFQLLAMLLLAAMVGVIVLTRHHLPGAKDRINVRRKVSRPLTNVISSQVGHEVVDEAPAQLPAQTEQRETAGD
ncbi:MAG: NADH-quinone oxidoreductase subunit J [Anaerolineae bacterium]|nr:NADH-quinone oxidoreductase subunit J [Anaerolineae bacterium]